MADELLLRGIIHDLSNALTVILGWAEEAQDGDAELKEQALRIVAERARSARALARRAIGASAEAPHETAATVCERLRDSLELEGNRREVSLQLDLGAAANCEVFEVAEFEQALQNLWLNALAHSPPRSTVRVRGERVGAAGLSLVVSDQGPGVPEAHRRRIFEGHSSREGGAGLGLQHSKRTAEAHGGGLELVPSERGASFRLSWRAIPAPQASRMALLERRVLLVEDDEAIVTLVTMAFEARGAEVVVVRSVDDLPRCASGGADAIVLDWSPIADNEPVWRAAIAANLPDTPVLVVTGQPERVSWADAMVVVKPFEVRQLVSLVARLPPQVSSPGSEP